MSKYLQRSLSLILALIFLASTTESYSNDPNLAQAEKELKKAFTTAGKNSMGRLFYLAFAENDQQTPPQALAIYVTSGYDTKVTMSNDQTGLLKTFDVKAFKVTPITQPDIDYSLEIRAQESEQAFGHKTIKLTSPYPISVYAINSRRVSTDGYLAIPVSGWGKKYIHCGYYDFNEFANNPWGAGFIVLAAEDRTRVSIRLRGIGQAYASTFFGKKIGQSINVTMQSGDAYMVSGDKTTRGLFDLTGTEIIADKPIGVISFHQRTMIPATVVTSGRDHMLEMLPPVQAWGTTYPTIELDRKSDKGDYFRVVASERNTTVKITSYDKKSKQVIFSDTQVILRDGEFMEYYEVGLTHPHNFSSLRGSTIFEADKPIFVMQYSYSANWDNNGRFDPMMMVVTPVEQFTTATIFQTPSNNSGDNEYTSNYFGLLAVGDAKDPRKNQEMLSTIKLDGKSVTDIDPSFFGNNIPTTNLFWAFLEVEMGPHVLEGETPFGGYIYGFASFDSYGWPAATAYRVVGEQDIFPPVPIIEGECGEFTITATELRNFPNWDTAQVETGVAVEPLLLDSTFNFKLPEFISASDDHNQTDTEWTFHPPHYKAFVHKFEVKNKRENGFAKIMYVDEADNDTIVYLWYEWDSLTVDPNPILFPDTRINTTSDDLTVTITSHSDSVITIKRIALDDNRLFKIKNGGLQNGEIKLPPRETINVILTYSPTQEYINVRPFLKDSANLIVETSCVDFKWPIYGRGVEPQIQVADWDAGTIPVGNQRCSNTPGTAFNFVVRNIGTMDLVITGIEAMPGEPFYMDNLVLEFPEPIIVKRAGDGNTGEINLFNEAVFTDAFQMCFRPTGAGPFTTTIKFISNATRTKDVATLRGNAISNGPVLSSYTWQRHRVESRTTPEYLVLENLPPDNDPALGSQITFTDVVITSTGNRTSEHFTLDVNNMLDNNNNKVTFGARLRPKGSTGAGIMSIRIPVIFHPMATEFDLNEVVEARFSDAESAQGTVVGTGFSPEVTVSPTNFPVRTLVDSYHLDADGSNTRKAVRIENTTSNVVKHPLRVNSVVKDANWNNPQDFFFVDVMDSDGNSLGLNSFPLSIDYEDFIELIVEFRPSAVGDRSMRFVVNTDEGNWNTQANAEPAIDNFDGIVTGVGMNTGREAIPQGVGNVLGCRNPEATITISNFSDSDELVIREINAVEVRRNGIVVPLVNNPFTPLNNLNNATVATNGAPQVARYVWSTQDEAAWEVDYEVSYFDVNGIPTPSDVVTLDGVAYAHRLDFSLNSYFGVVPGDVIREYPIKLAAQASPIAGLNVYQDIQVSKFKIGLRFPSRLITSKFNNAPIMVRPGNSLGGQWNFQSTEERDPNDDNFKILTISGESANGIITGNGNLVLVDLYTLLANTITFEMELVNSEFLFTDNNGNTLTACVFPDQTPGLIEYEICASNLRNIRLTNTNFGLEAIKPNPVTSAMATIEYSVGFETDTRIDIVNSNGQVVGVPVDSRLASGAYTLTLPTEGLANGVYFIRMVSGPYEDTIEMVITK